MVITTKAEDVRLSDPVTPVEIYHPVSPLKSCLGENIHANILPSHQNRKKSISCALSVKWINKRSGKSLEYSIIQGHNKKQ